MEDYNEMVFVETVLKKIGFDCLGLQNDNSLADKVLGFSPALIIADGFGRKINGLVLSQKIKRPKGFPKMLLVMSPPETVSDDDRQRMKIDGLIDRPIHPVQIVEEIARILELDIKSIRQKLDKLGMFQDAAKEEMQIVKGKQKKVVAQQLIHLKPTEIDIEKRIENYKDYLEHLPESDVDTVSRKKVLEQVQEFRSREDDPEIHDIDEERSAFVKALFKR